jgi:hypothetical protein
VKSSGPKLPNYIKNDIRIICFMTEILRGAQSSGAQNSVNHSPQALK